MNDLNYIAIENLLFGYEKGKVIINKINLNINKNEITIIVGPNGSGKTTLGKLMVGILKPISGDIFISGNNLKEIPLAQVGSEIGYLFQNPDKHFFANTVKEELGFVDDLKGIDEEIIDKKIDDILKLFELEEVKKAPPLILSQGEKQRLAIGTILINEPRYMILDEPTRSLDAKRKEALLDILSNLKEKGIGMTIFSHDSHLIENLPQRVIEIRRGEIVYDKRL